MSTFDNFTVHPYKYLDICTWEETSKPKISFVDSFDYLDEKDTPSAVEVVRAVFAEADGSGGC